MNKIMRRCVINLFLFLAVSISVLAGEHPKQRLITVIGEGEVKVMPDEVILTLGVETWGKDLIIAKRENDEIAKKVLALAKKYEIETKNVKTVHIRIEPRYKDIYKRSTLIGYYVRKTIVFRLRDISKFEGLLSSALEAGANSVYGVQFSTTELKKYRHQARTFAIRDAKQKANELAKELGQKVGKPHTILEEPSGWWSRYYSGTAGRIGGMPQNVRGIAGESESNIAPGQINVKAKVTVSFELI